MNKKEEKSLLERARALVDHFKKTRELSVSGVYGIYNEITGKNERPDTCLSCLERRAKDIESWVVEEERKKAASSETRDTVKEEKPKRRK